jgi:methylase of polypeptide subunit release factors
MIAKIPLPDGSTIGIQYSKDVYDPNYSSYKDTIGLAHECIKEVNPTRFVDVGCGSGVIGLAIKKMHPLVDVTLCDIDKNAVKQAKRNAERLGLKVTVMQLDLMPKTQFYPVVAANLPTFDSEQMKSEPLHGPEVAYKGEDDDGLGLYRKLLDQVDTGAFIICEVQEKHQPNFYKLLDELMVFQVVAKSAMAFALFKRPVPEYTDQLDKPPKGKKILT